MATVKIKVKTKIKIKIKTKIEVGEVLNGRWLAWDAQLLLWTGGRAWGRPALDS